MPVYLLLCLQLFTLFTLFAINTAIFQARMLEWVAFPFSRGSSQPRDQARIFTFQADSLPAESQGKPKNIGVDSLSLLQGIFLTQELNWGLLNCRQILYQLRWSPETLQVSKMVGETTSIQFHCPICSKEKLSPLEKIISVY